MENLPEDTHALLEHLCRQLAQAPDGARNKPLFDAALKMGHHVGAGLIDEGTAHRRLFAASIQGGHDINDAQSTTLSGLHIGMEHDDAIQRLRSVVLPSADPDLVARQIAKDCEVDGKPGLLSLDHGESYYQFDPDQGWTCLSKSEMEQLILKKCRQYRAQTEKGHKKLTNTRRFRAEVLDFLRYEHMLQECRDDLPKYEGQPCAFHQVAVANGILDLRNGELQTHSPDLLAISRLAVPWEGVTKITAWTSFLESSIPVEEDRILLQMWMGYLLTRDTRQQKMMWFIGRTGSGKGTILRIIGKLLGNLTAGTQLERLGDDFGLEPLFDKASITIGDADISQRRQAQLRALLLSIVGEDIVAVNRKGRPIIQMKLDARLTLASNRNIPFENADGAISARMLCVRFPNSFRQNGDPNLNERLEAELPGILAWAVEGWRKLQEAGRFPKTESTTRLLQENEIESDPCREWLHDNFQQGVGGIFVDELYRDYKHAMEGRERILDCSVVGRNLRVLFPNVKGTKRTAPCGKRRAYYDGLIPKAE